MSNVVQFLETLACTPGTLSADAFASALASAGLTPEARAALSGKDAEALNAVLGGRSTVLCFVAPAEDDEPVEDEPQGDEPDSPERDASRAA
ncbi:MAG TPA: hypothetical protein VLM17_05605 [Xanthomonadaceae bacterium]|nr:hypothetical protein [Xanthomonadaceae bacterium]